MTAKLFINPDGAHPQAQAVLAYLRTNSGIEKSWSKTLEEYQAEPKVARWENCREQGYVVYMMDHALSRQINIAFFEHRNSDEICAVVFEKGTLNAPTIDSIPLSHPYHNSKYAVSHKTNWGEAKAMAEWIYAQLEAFWLQSGGA